MIYMIKTTTARMTAIITILRLPARKNVLREIPWDNIYLKLGEKNIMPMIGIQIKAMKSPDPAGPSVSASLRTAKDIRRLSSKTAAQLTICQLNKAVKCNLVIF